MRAISRQEAREVDLRAWNELGIPTICLMENAGAGAAGIALGMLPGGARDVLCVCGPGQNGGDGFVVARHAAIAGHRVRILLLTGSQGGDPPGDAGVNLRICRAMGLPVHAAGPGSWERAFGPSTDLMVDALFGTGLVRPLDGAAAELVERISAAARPVLSLDLPSGLDCDTGVPLGPCVRADVTATFVAPKLGFLRPGAAAWTGAVHVVGIGAPLDRPGGARPRNPGAACDP